MTLRGWWLAAAVPLVVCASPASADDADANASLSLGGSGAAASDDPSSDLDAETAVPADQGPPWGNERGTWEAGLFWGLFFPSTKHELFDDAVVAGKPDRLEPVTPELGLRLGWFPLRVLAFELEAGLLPSQTRSSDKGVNLFALRAHGMLLAPTKSIVPFLLVGGGLLGVTSDDDALGSDADGEMHVGLGIEALMTKALALRLEGRDNITGARGKDKLTQHWEILLGFSVISGREEPPPPPPPDADGDGIVDAKDKCPNAAGPAPEGCPPPPDADGDGVADPDDKCPNEAGVDSDDPAKRGCPPPPPDGDGDGVPDASDKCPTEKGDGPDGCLQDGDGDGLVDRDDKCAGEPETKNGFQDEDGCPDELPQEVKKFTGAIQGIVFGANEATIRAVSFPTLDAAAKVLSEYPSLRIEISGHTDNSGKPERNLELSAQRANSVKTYLVSKGVAADRITTRGAGPSEPVADNATKAGRAQNRRIEFKLLQDQAPSPTPSPSP